MASLLDVAILRTPVPRTAPSITSPDTRARMEAAPVAIGSPLPANATDDAAVTDPTLAPSVANASLPLSLSSSAPSSAVSDELANELTRNDETTNTILRARCDDVARRVIREGGHVSMASLAREVGTTPPTLKRLMATPLYRDTYNRVSDELLGTIDDRIADERLDTLVRSDTLQRRALTVLSEAMMIARRHMADVGDGKVVARPQLLKVAVDAAAEVRQIVTARSTVGQTGSTVNVNITRNQATIIQGAFRESGVDLSDVLGDAFGAAAIPATAIPSIAVLKE